MATGTSIVTRAYSKAGIKTAESPLTASELEDGWDQLVDMLNAWEGSGIVLGFSEPASISDELRLPKSSIAAIKSSLSIKLLNELKTQIPIGLAVEQEADFSLMLRSIVSIGDVNFPSTLPIGSGNQCPDFNEDRRFFPEDEKENF